MGRISLRGPLSLSCGAIWCEDPYREVVVLLVGDSVGIAECSHVLLLFRKSGVANLAFRGCFFPFLPLFSSLK